MLLGANLLLVRIWWPLGLTRGVRLIRPWSPRVKGMTSTWLSLIRRSGLSLDLGRPHRLGLMLIWSSARLLCIVYVERLYMNRSLLMARILGGRYSLWLRMLRNSLLSLRQSRCTALHRR